MSILDLHGDDLMAAASRYIKPATPEPKFSAWSLATAVPRGAGEAVLQIAASGTELAQAPAKRRGLESADGAMTNEFSDVFREAGRDLRPDAQTGHVAEQMLYQFARGATKIVGGFLAAGPVGVIGMGVEEANTQSDELRRAGVTDLRTRATAGAAQGAGLALAALPIAGQGLASTAALYVAGGPGGFIAQQALTREVLKSGGYDKQAAQFDPFDPVGLTVASLVPAAFAAVALRGQAKAAAAAREQATLAGPVPSELTPTAAAVRDTVAPEVVDAARVTFGVERRAASNPMPRGGRAEDAHETALARAEAAMSRGESVAVSDIVPPRVVEGLDAFLQRTKIKADPLPPEVRGDFLGFVRSVGGIDFAQKWDITGEKNGIRANPAGIFRSGGQSTDELAMLAQEAGYLRDGTDSGAFVELVQRAVQGERVLKMTEQAEAASRTQYMESMSARLEAVEGRLRLLGVDTAPAGGNVAALEAYAQANEPAILAAALDEARVADELTPEYEALRQQARQVVDDMATGERTLQQYEADVRPLSPVMRRMVRREIDATPAPQAANPETAAPARSAGPPAEAPTVPAAGTAPAAEAAGLNARIAQIEAEFPDLMVRMDGDEAALPLADFLARAQREADELAADAPLVQVLAECSLLNGTGA